MFKRRRTGRKSGPRRKTYWDGIYLQGDGFLLGNSPDVTLGEILTFWVKWPSGMRSPTPPGSGIQYSGEVESSDETLVKTRMLHTTQATIDAILALAAQGATCAYGIIAMDCRDPENFDNAFYAYDAASFTLPPAPQPVFDLQEDWIIRNTFGPILNGTIHENGSEVDSYQSRAMRKLPEGTGLLGVLQCSNFNEDADTQWTVYTSFEARFLLKAGAYRV